MAPFGVRKFRKLVLVGSFSVLAEFLMGFLASVLSGRFLGEQALAGISLLSPVFTSVIFLAGLFGVGMGVNYALAMGRCDRNEAHALFSQAVWSVLTVGVIFALALFLGFDAYLDFLAPDPSVAAYARDYLKLFLPVALLEPAAVLLLNVCYADGDDVLCYTAYAGQLAVNLAVSIVGLRCGHGVAACALGATAGFAFAVAILSLHFLRATNSFRLVRVFSWRRAQTIVMTSFGDSSGFLCNAALYFCLGKLVIARFGSETLPVLAVVVGTLGLLELFNGVGVAAQPIVSVYVGERNYRAARRVMHDALRVSASEGLAATALLLGAPGLVVSLLGVTDPAVVSAAKSAVRILSAGFVLTAVSNLLNGYYILVGRERLAIGFTFFKWLLVPLALSVALAPFGATALWWALGLAPCAAFAAFCLFLARRYGRSSVPLVLDRSRDAATTVFDLELTETEIAMVAARVGAAVGTADPAKAVRARLLVEETLMVVKERNLARRVAAEVTVDLNEGILVTMRDDGEIFDITDSDAKVSGLRTFLVASMMERQQAKVNLVTTGFNRNVFRL